MEVICGVGVKSRKHMLCWSLITAVEVNGYNATSQAGWREHWKVLELLLANGAACQAADIAGDWLYGECTARKSSN